MEGVVLSKYLKLLFWIFVCINKLDMTQLVQNTKRLSALSNIFTSVGWNNQIIEKALGMAAGCRSVFRSFLAFCEQIVAAKLLRSTPLSSVFVGNNLLGLYLNEITLDSMDF